MFLVNFLNVVELNGFLLFDLIILGILKVEIILLRIGIVVFVKDNFVILIIGYCENLLVIMSRLFLDGRSCLI